MRWVRRTTGKDRRDQDGVAALEMAFISMFLLLLGFGALPIYSLAHGYHEAVNASADTLRYATSVDANAHEAKAPDGTTLRNPDGTPVITRRPTSSDVAAFARAAAGDDQLAITVRVCPVSGGACVTDTCPVRQSCSGNRLLTAVSGDTIEVTVDKSVDMRLIGAAANAMTSFFGNGSVFPQGDQIMTSKDSGREE